MKPVRFSRGFVVVVLIVLLVAAACGGSATEQLSEAAAPEEDTAAAVEPTTAVAEEASAPTEAPAEAPAEAPTEAPAEVPAATAEPATLTAQGFGQDDQTVGYGFVVSNPNEAVAFEMIAYQVVATDAGGTVLATDSGFITVLLPGETLGIGGPIYLDEGQVVTAVEVQLSGGDIVATDSKVNFTVERRLFLTNKFSDDVSSVIVSPFNQTLENVLVSAITYGADGAINGGGRSYINFLHGGSATGVTVLVRASGDVARAELYPTLSSLPLPDGGENVLPNALPLELVNDGFSVDRLGQWYGLLVRNPNTTFALENSRFRLVAFNADGNVIGTDEGYLKLLLPGQEQGLSNSLLIKGEERVASVEAQVYTGEFITADPDLILFRAENVALLPGSFDPTVSGMIVNPYTEPVTKVRISALAFDSDDHIIGAGFTYLDFLSARGSAAVNVLIHVAAEPARVELYAALSSLSQIGE